MQIAHGLAEHSARNGRRADPLAGGGQHVELLGQHCRDAGLTDVTVRVYDGDRHEIFNETNRDEITDEVITGLKGHV